MPRLMLGVSTILLCLICISLAQNVSPDTTREQKSPPVQISDYWNVLAHRLSEAEPLRVANARSRDLFGGIQIEVVVNEQGNVISAKIANEKDDNIHENLYPAALAQAKSWKYKPFEKDGKPVAATFTEYVRILPPEDLPKVHAPFPEIKDLKSLRITLKRTTCFGSCPAYTVEISGDGSVVYQGQSYVVLTGEHHDQISKEALSQILDAFRKADYFSLKDQYAFGVTDNPTTITSIAFDGTKKSVIDYVGEQAGMPHAVAQLEQTVDRVAGTLKWVYGNAETLPSLMREKWDFKSAEAGLTLVRAACERFNRALMADPALIRELVVAGVPPDAHGPNGRTALECVAAEKDKETVIFLMEAGAAKGDPAVKNEALASAARAGDLQLVRLMLKYGADPNATDGKGQTILMSAAASGVPEVLTEVLKYHPDVNARGPDQQTALSFASQDLYFRGPDSDREAREKQRGEVAAMLLKAGADPHLADKDGNTPLHKAHILPVAEALIRNGADVNARNNRGETPLMVTYSDGVVKLLLQSGADISARDNAGHTALERARSSGFQDKIKALEAFQSTSPGKSQ